MVFINRPSQSSILIIYIFLCKSVSATVITASTRIPIPINDLINLTIPVVSLARGPFHCLKSEYPGGQIDVQICRPQLDTWLGSIIIDRPILYENREVGHVLTGLPCRIGIRPLLPGRSIVLSLRQILDDLLLLLAACESSGRGGWTEINATTWIISVDGGAAKLHLGTDSMAKATM